MKKFLISLILIGAIVAPATGTTIIDTTGDDLFPWPWGTECPFPWSKIEGLYQVKAGKNSSYKGHVIELTVSSEEGDGSRELEIVQYDSSGDLHAEGVGYADEDGLIVKGYMDRERDEKGYKVFVRTYISNTTKQVTNRVKNCRDRKTVTAITFCPLRGKKCMETENYVLEKLELP